MTSERIKEIQEQTAYPDSISVQQALLQVWNECSTSSQTDENGKPLTYWGGLKDRTCDHTNCREVCPECQLPQQETYGSKGSGMSEKPTNQTEILYTKEEVMDAIRMARQIDYCNADYEILLSLKLK